MTKSLIYDILLYYNITKGILVIATVRLDEHMEKTLESLSSRLHKKKSDVIREAIAFYALNIDKSKNSRILSAVEKTKEADRRINAEMEGTLSDGI